MLVDLTPAEIAHISAATHTMAVNLKNPVTRAACTAISKRFAQLIKTTPGLRESAQEELTKAREAFFGNSN